MRKLRTVTTAVHGPVFGLVLAAVCAAVAPRQGAAQSAAAETPTAPSTSLPAATSAAIPASSPAARPNVVWRVDAGMERRLERFRAASGGRVEAIARAGNWWGGPGVIAFAAILWIGARVIGNARAARVGLRGTEGLAVASAISGIVKGLAGRARPAIAPGEPWHWHFNRGWTNADFFSMPSGHTTATVAFTVAATIAAWRYGRGRGAAFGTVLTLSALWVGCSRMYTNQHWLSDVVAGGVLGATTSFALARAHARYPAAAYHRLMLGRAGTEAG